MLPAHVFADVVGCLNLYDLDALLLTDARCSDLAHSAASRIRVFDFSDFNFFVYTNEAVIRKLGPSQVPKWTVLKFLDEADLVEFIPAALRNCVLGSLSPLYKTSCDALREVARTMVITGSLFLNAPAFASAHDLVEFAVSFRSVKRVSVHCNDSQIHAFVDHFRRRGFEQHETGPFGTWLSFVSRSA